MENELQKEPGGREAKVGLGREEEGGGRGGGRRGEGRRKGGEGRGRDRGGEGREAKGQRVCLENPRRSSARLCPSQPCRRVEPFPGRKALVTAGKGPTGVGGSLHFPTLLLAQLTLSP